jgi:hypothetical protein
MHASVFILHAIIDFITLTIYCIFYYLAYYDRRLTQYSPKNRIGKYFDRF